MNERRVAAPLARHESVKAMVGKSVVIRLAGDFDAYNCPELRRLLEPAKGAEDVVIDFTATRYVDSSCLKELAALRRFRLEKGLPAVRLVVPGRNLRKLLNIVGFDLVFPLFDSLDDALQTATT